MLRSDTGFTLLELMVVMAIVAVLAAVAVPNLRPFIQSNRLTAASNDLLHSFQLARSEATRQQANVVVCAAANPVTAPKCDGTSFTGWIVFVDANSNWVYDTGDSILERHDTLDPSITVKNDNNPIESYAPTGFALPASTKTPTRNISMCIQATRPSNTAQQRALVIARTGRAVVSMTTTVACP